MERSRQHHQSSKRRVHDDRDKQGHKSRHDLRASQPHKPRPRSPVDRDLGSRSQTTAGQNDYLASWLKDAYPHRNHPPDLESVVEETRQRKRARESSDVSESPEEDSMPTKSAFEKRPRHKTHADKYDYKDGLGRRRKGSREQRAVYSKGRQRNEHGLGPTQLTQKENNDGKQVKKGSQKVLDLYQRPIETSPEPEPNPSRPHRSRKRRDNGARFDKDLQEINDFFNRKTGGDRRKIAHGRHSQTPGEDYDPFELPRSHSSGIGDDEAHLRRPWYSEPSGRESQPEKSPSINKSTDVLTWSTSEHLPNSLREHEKYSEQESESPERVRLEKKRVSVPNRGRERQLKVGKSQERRRDSRSDGNRRERSSQMPPPPSALLYCHQKENIPPGDYGDPYHYSQRTLNEDPYEGLVANHVMGDWHHRAPHGLGLRSFEWPPAQRVTRPLLADRGLGQNQLLPQRRRFGYEGRLSELNVGCFPHSSQAEFLPGVERKYPLGPPAALNARYPMEETLAMPTGYGCGSIGPVNRISTTGTGANFHSPWESGNPPGSGYDLGANDAVAPAYYSTESVENPRKQLERMKREDFVERLEQEALERLEPLPAAVGLEFQDRGLIKLSTQAREPSSRIELDGLGSRQASLEGRMEQVMTNRNPLPHLSAGLLTPTHGFTPLTPPVMHESRIHQPLEEGCLSTIWER